MDNKGEKIRDEINYLHEQKGVSYEFMRLKSEISVRQFNQFHNSKINLNEFNLAKIERFLNNWWDEKRFN